MKWFEKREDKILNSRLGPIFIPPPPPPPKNVQEAQLLISQIIDWVRAGNKEYELKAWESLSSFASDQAEKLNQEKKG